MQIVELRAENVKRLSAVTIRPTGPVVEITGKNEAGKSSVLDSIWMALGGAEVPVQAIQALPYVLTVVLLAGFIGKAVAPKALGTPYVKERE